MVGQEQVEKYHISLDQRHNHNARDSPPTRQRRDECREDAKNDIERWTGEQKMMWEKGETVGERDADGESSPMLWSSLLRECGENDSVSSPSSRR